MPKVPSKFTATALAGAFLLTVLLFAPAPTNAAEEFVHAPAVSCPSLLLKHWKASSDEEKRSFLLGFTTMLEMERTWQGDKPLPIGKSLNHSWVKGLANVTLDEMRQTLDTYVAQNPDEMDMSVVRVLGNAYVAPKLTPTERNEAKSHLRQIKLIK